jgi:murein hydrolase activator
VRYAPLLATMLLLLAAGAGVHAQSAGDDRQSLAEARREAEAATRRSERLENAARRATGDADRARAEAEALAARIEAAEADLTAAERRIAIIGAMQAAQRARLAARQGPVIRLTAALQTMTRRPAALALVQPGSVRDAVHVRSLLAAIMPEVRRRTAALRTEVEQGADLRRRSETARSGLVESRTALRQRRVDLARFERAQRARSQQLAGLALSQSDRALAFGEEARTLSQTIGSRADQERRAASLAQLPGPVQRPGPAPEAGERISYALPVEGRVLVGVGEISDGGVHARGLTLETAAEAPVVAPAGGRIAYAGPFRRYGNVVIIDHGGGWQSVITDLASLSVRQGQTVRRGASLGAAGAGSPRITVELRRNGRPVPVAQIIGG